MDDSNDDLEKWKSIAKQPPWTQFYDRLSLLSPILWIRCAAFKRISLKPLVHSFLAVLIPPTIAAYSLSDKEVSSTTIQLVYGTWSLAWMYKATSAALCPVFSTVSGFVSNSSSTRPSAWKCLAARIQAGTAYRTSTYDVYLPTTTSTSSTTTTPILFFTGASVEHVAYAEPAALLADHGYLVVVVSATPVFMVDMALFRFWPFTLRRLQRTIEQKHCTTSSWVLMGHSMGSFLCTKLAQRVLRVSKIVLWGAAPFVDYVEKDMPQDIPTLVVQASKDVVISSFATPAAWNEFWKRLPVKTLRYEIENGTHSGFGSYIPTFAPEVEGMPRDLQQREAVRITVDFLCGRQVSA